MFNSIKDKLEDINFERQLKKAEKDRLKEDREKGRVTQVNCSNKKDFKYYTSIKAPIIYIEGELYSEIKKEMENEKGVIFKSVVMAMSKVGKTMAKKSSINPASVALFIGAVCLGNLSTSSLDGYEAEINIPNRYILLKRK